jgi:pimeloyl-ACP methyl ester carboxylesterase
MGIVLSSSTLQGLPMKLELLSTIPEGPKREVSVLLVHGICLGAWVWEDNFMPYLAGQGYPTYALSLRGHGESAGGDKVARWSVKDFSDDLAWAIEQIGGPVVVIGHSMGGGVAQYSLRQGRRMAGLVLMASVPPHGLLRASMSMYNRNPKLWEELQKPRSGRLTDADFAIVEGGIFSEPLTAQTRKAMLRRLNEPAIQASIELMGWHPIAPLPWGAPPIMVMGGERDEFVPATDVMLTGVYYGVAPSIVRGSAHAIMLEPSWETAADLVCEWLIRRFPQRGGAAGPA